MEEKYPWIKDLIGNQENIMTQKQLTPIYTKVNFLLLTKKYEAINYILDNINTEIAHETLLITLLRITYKQKAKFPIWKEMFDKTKDELVKRKIDIELKL